jgi:class 3 adenylate cyclase
MSGAPTVLRPPSSAAGRVRLGVWILHMALPLLALWLLLAQPSLDVTWQHQPSHFWLVMGVAGINVILSLQVLRAARIRNDARVLLVGYAFMVAAGFLFLHALATPRVIVEAANGGFEIATPVGLGLASALFAAASLEYSSETARRIVETESVTRSVIIVLMILWGIVSVAQLPPLADSLAERAEGPLLWLAVLSIGLYVFTAWRFFVSHRRKSSVMLVALITAAALLAEAMATIIWARSWQLSWWLWHILMAAAFGFVAYSTYVQYQREGGAAGIFDGIVSHETAAEIRDEFGGALETLTNTLQRSVQSGMTDEELDLILTGLRTRFAMTEGQSEVLARAARSLATERDQANRLGALAQIATEGWVDRDEEDLLDGIADVITERFSPDVVRIGLLTQDGLRYPDRLATGAWPEEGDRYDKDLTVGRDRAGVVEFARPEGRFRPRDYSIMDTLVAEIGISLDNVRLYRQLDNLFRTYMSPDVADTLRADPTQAGLGGSVVELTALFADLRGFTSFSEQTDPTEVMEVLNRYFGAAVPVILRNGGTVIQFVGDALLAVFDAPQPRPDHEYRAAKSALEMQEAIEREAGGQADAPKFRIGINTGAALVGNVGSAEMRSFNVVGDAVNVASRLETASEPGHVLIGESTYEAIADRVEVEPMGPLSLKGKERPVEAYRLLNL